MSGFRTERSVITAFAVAQCSVAKGGGGGGGGGNDDSRYLVETTRSMVNERDPSPALVI